MDKPQALWTFLQRMIHERWEVRTPNGDHFHLCWTRSGANRMAARRNEIAARRNRRHRTGRHEFYSVRAVWL